MEPATLFGHSGRSKEPPLSREVLVAGQGLPPCVALTGGIACGKSLLGRMLADLGAEVVDADDVVHRLQEPGGELCSRIAQEFGPGFLTDSGGVDRKRLGVLVFENSEARCRLNSLCHPVVRRWFDRWRSLPATGWARVALIPLLFESGWETEWDVTVCITCRQALQVSRLRYRGLSRKAALARVRAQMPLLEKAKRSDVVVKNNEGLDELAVEAVQLKQRLLERYSL